MRSNQLGRLPPIHPALMRYLPQKLSQWLPVGEARIEEPIATGFADEQSALPHTLTEINNLPQAHKHAIYRSLLPAILLERFHIDPFTLSREGEPLVFISCPEGSYTLEIAIWRKMDDPDPVTYLHLADKPNNQIMVLFVQFNDLDAPRFDTDVDANGNPTYFGTASRNIPAELAAMKAGLAPGQVRKGLSMFREFMPLFEHFLSRMGHEMYFLEPLAYHTAVIFERMGFGYMRGQREMEEIHREFQPGGRYHSQLTANNPFRSPDAWSRVRGRSWAIHDGILGHPFDGFEMYKHLGKKMQVNTCPETTW